MTGANSHRAQDPGTLTTLHVHQALAGERQSLEWLVQRFTPLLRLQATHRLGGHAQPADVDDLVADAWQALLQGLALIQPRDGRLTPVILTFLAETIRRRAYDLLRWQQRANALDLRPGESVRSALATVADGETTRAIIEAINRLEPENRTVLLMRGVEGLPYQTIAARLHLLPNTVAQRYGRALRRLRNSLPGSVFEELSDV